MSKVKGFTFEFRVRSISPEPFDQFSWCFTHMLLLVRRCASYLNSRSQVKVTGFTLEFRVCSISHETMRRFSLNFIQIFLWVRLCAELMTQLHRVTFKVTIQCHVIYPSIFVRPIPPKLSELVSLYFIQMFPLVRQCAEPMTQLRRLKVKVTVQWHKLYPWILCPLHIIEPFERFL